MSGSLNQLSSQLNTLYRGRNLKMFCNLIRSTKTVRSSCEYIDLPKSILALNFRSLPVTVMYLQMPNVKIKLNMIISKTPRVMNDKVLMPWLQFTSIN